MEITPVKYGESVLSEKMIFINGDNDKVRKFVFKVYLVKSDEFPVCENLKIIKIGGHSKGSCIVEIKADDKIYILTGDECYLRECLDNRIPTGSLNDQH